MNDRFRRPRHRTTKSGAADNRGRESLVNETDARESRDNFGVSDDGAGHRRQRSYDVEAASPNVGIPTRRQRISVFWLAPLLAGLLGVYLAFSFYSSQGPDIDIQFASAEGLVAGKTPIRYRDVNIGVVDSIRLNDDLDSVVVAAKMTPDSWRYLNEFARFWVVRPRVGTSGVSGLGTLLSGPYIQVNSILGGEFQSQFKGLEQPPLTDEDAPGLRLKLQAKQAGYVSIGSPVYYRQVIVGQIEAQRFMDNYDGVEFTIFVDAPHHRIIRNTTQFWNVSGVNLTVNSTGFKVRTPSLEGLAQGGVSFDIIDEYEFPERVEDGHVFSLHDSRESATEEMIQGISSGKYRYVIYFEGSVRGLSRGAPVEYKGVQIGRVTDIRLDYNRATGTTHVPVYIEMQPERVRGFQLNGLEDPEIIHNTIANGLRAKLQTGSLLTGQLFVALDFYDENTEPLAKNDEGIYVMPSVASDIDQVTEGLQTALAKINALPLQALVENANSTVERANVVMGRIEQLGLASKLGGTIDSADGAIHEYTRLASKTRKVVEKLSGQLQQFAATANESMAGIAPDSPLYYNLLNTLKDVQAMSRAVLAVSESVEKKPEEFLFGK